MARYGANELLEAFTEFILGMREEYLQQEAKFVVVSHDWGGVITARLASEAYQLADRFVVASAVIVCILRGRVELKFGLEWTC